MSCNTSDQQLTQDPGNPERQSQEASCSGHYSQGAVAGSLTAQQITSTENDLRQVDDLDWTKELKDLTCLAFEAQTDAATRTLNILIQSELRVRSNTERAGFNATLAETLCSVLRTNWMRKAKCTWLHRDVAVCDEKNLEEYVEKFSREWYSRVGREKAAQITPDIIRRVILKDDAPAFDALLGERWTDKKPEDLDIANKMQECISKLRSNDSMLIWTAKQNVLAKLGDVRRKNWRHVGQKEVLHWSKMLQTCLKTIDDPGLRRPRPQTAKHKAESIGAHREFRGEQDAVSGSSKSSLDSVGCMFDPLQSEMKATEAHYKLYRDTHGPRWTHSGIQSETPLAAQPDHLTSSRALNHTATIRCISASPDVASSAGLCSQQHLQNFVGAESSSQDHLARGPFPELASDGGHSTISWDTQLEPPLMEPPPDDSTQWVVPQMSYHLHHGSQPFGGELGEQSWADHNVNDVLLDAELASFANALFSDSAPCPQVAAHALPEHPFFHSQVDLFGVTAVDSSCLVAEADPESQNHKDGLGTLHNAAPVAMGPHVSQAAYIPQRVGSHWIDSNLAYSLAGRTDDLGMSEDEIASALTATPTKDSQTWAAGNARGGNFM